MRAWSKLQHPRRPGEGWEEGRRFATVSGKVPSARLDSFIGDATGVKWEKNVGHQHNGICEPGNVEALAELICTYSDVAGCSWDWKRVELNKVLIIIKDVFFYQ